MGTEETYRTLASPGEAALAVRGSRFQSSVVPVQDGAAAEATIDESAAAHPDATHVVPAYRIRVDPFREWSSDAGEPRGSAGAPVLSVLQGEELENVVSIVVRYFGGTKLGTGGLVRAYREATTLAIAETTVVTRRPQTRFQVETTYDDSGTVRSVLEASDATFDARYEERVGFEVSVSTTEAAELRDRLLSATSGRVELAEE